MAAPRRPTRARRCLELVGTLAGCALFVAGTLFTMTVFGAIVGVPLVVAGLGLITTADRC